MGPLSVLTSHPTPILCHLSLLPISVQEESLLESVKFVSQLLKLEFIYHPASTILDNYNTTIEGMKKRGVLTPSQDGLSLTIHPKGHDSFMFLNMLLWPFIDTYWITLSTLMQLQPNLIMVCLSPF